MKKIKYIGICGVARSGKDTLADSLQSVIKDMFPNLKVSRDSLAAPLKKDLSPFLSEHFQKDIFNLTDEEKEMFRPLMVAYGFARRKTTKGTWFTSLLEKRQEIESPDICIVSDIRYAEYDSDELQWIKSKPNSRLIHISRHDLIDGTKIYQKAPNLDEETNDPILKNGADFKVDLESCKNENDLQKKFTKCCEKFVHENIKIFI